MASEHDIITIQNIDNEDFKFEYDRASGNYPYTIKSGEIKRFPRFLAKHAVKHLIDKILTKREVRISNIVMRQQLAEKIIVEEESFQEKPKVTEAERVQKEVEKLNAPSDLDAILKRRKERFRKKEKEETATEVAPKEEMDKSPEEEFEGLKTEKKKPVAIKTEPKPKPEKDEKAIKLPTRKELYDYIVEEKKITLTKDVKKDFDTLSIKELVKDFNYPLLD